MKKVIFIVIFLSALNTLGFKGCGSKVKFGLFSVPIDRLEEVSEKGFRMVRVEYRTEGTCNYITDFGPSHPLRQYIEAAIDAGIETILFHPDIRLFFWSRYPCNPLYTVQNSKNELDALFDTLYVNYSGRINFITYMDEPSIGKLNQGMPLDSLIEVVRYGKAKAASYGIPWWIASDSGPRCIENPNCTYPEWFHSKEFADLLLITQYEIGFDYRNYRFPESAWSEKRSYHDREQRDFQGPISLIVAAHPFDHTNYGGSNDNYYPGVQDILKWIQLARRYNEMVWIYIAHDGNTLWELPDTTHSQMKMLYETVE
jgi:hypothetical protein